MTEHDTHPRADTAPKTGDVAPRFSLPDETGKVHALAEGLAAGKPVVLIFMRGEW